jgi:hypothetical protein
LPVAITLATVLVAGGLLGGNNAAAAKTTWKHYHHRSHHHLHHAKASWRRSSREVSAQHGITCETVRAFVSQVGLAAARAMAQAHGMTKAQEHQARLCLAKRD